MNVLIPALAGLYAGLMALGALHLITTIHATRRNPMTVYCVGCHQPLQPGQPRKVTTAGVSHRNPECLTSWAARNPGKPTPRQAATR